jgi:hypothetical protein
MVSGWGRPLRFMIASAVMERAPISAAIFDADDAKMDTRSELGQIEGTSMIGKSQGETEIPLDSVEWVLRAGG